MLRKNEHKEFWYALRGPQSEIPAPEHLDECYLEVADIKTSWRGNHAKWTIDLRVYDNAGYGGANSAYQESEMGPLSICELPNILLQCPTELRQHIGDHRCEEELVRRQREAHATLMECGREYESLRERNILQNHRMLMQLGLDFDPVNGNHLEAPAESEGTSDNYSECSSESEDPLALEDPLARLGRQARHRHKLARDLLSLHESSGNGGVMERGLYVGGYHGSDSGDEDVIGANTRGAKKRRMTEMSGHQLPGDSASDSTPEMSAAAGRGCSAFFDSSVAARCGKSPRGAAGSSSMSLPPPCPSSGKSQRGAASRREEEDLQYPKPSSFMANALSDDDSSSENEDDNPPDSEEPELWATDFLRKQRLSVGYDALVDETELDSIRVQGASIFSLAQVGMVLNLAYGRGVDMLSTSDEKNLGGDWVQLTSFPAAVYVQVPDAMSREEFLYTLNDVISFEHKFVKPPSRFFYAKGGGNDKKVSQITSVPRNCSCVVLQRALVTLGVTRYSFAMHGTSLTVGDFKSFSFLETDFMAGLAPGEVKDFKIIVDFSMTHRFPGLWSVRGPSDGGCRTFYEEGDISDSYGSVRLRALVQDADGRKVLHFDVPREKKSDYPTLYSMRRVIGVDGMTFYSPLQHQRKGVVSVHTEWKSLGSTTSGCLQRVGTMEDVIARIEESDNSRLNLPRHNSASSEAGSTARPLKYSEGMRSEARVVFFENLTHATVRAKARVAVEMKQYVMCECLGWQRRDIKRVLQRGRAMCEALKETLCGQGNSASTVEQRHSIAVLYNILGYSSGLVMASAFRKQTAKHILLGKGLKSDGCVSLAPWHDLGWYIQEGLKAKRILQQNKDATLKDIRSMCFFADRRALGHELEGARISWKVKGKDQWYSKGKVVFESKSKAADEIYRLFKKNWRKHVSMSPSARRWAVARERGEQKQQAELSKAYPCRPANAEALRSLHQLRLHGDKWVVNARKRTRGIVLGVDTSDDDE